MIQAWVSLSMAVAMSAARPIQVQFAREGLGRPVMLSLGGDTPHLGFAGKLILRDRTRSLQSVCANVGAPVHVGQFFWIRQRQASQMGANYRLAASIVARCFNRATTADQCAGLQLAVWEAIEDGGQVPDFYAGAFQVRASQDVVNFAQQAYATAGEGGEALFLETRQSRGQDQMLPIN